MKVAIVYNRNSQSVINLFGMPNREKIGMKTIDRLADALRKGGHQVTAFEGDKDLIGKLEEENPDYDWDDIAAVLEDHGFETVDFILGPALD